MKTGKAPGEDGIKPKMLKTINVYGIRWLTRVCQEVCRNELAPTQWQTNVVIRKKKCANCRIISLINVPDYVYANCLEKNFREIVEPELADAQCDFRPKICLAASL